MREIVVFSGSAHRELAAAVCHHLDVPLAPSRHTRFANDCLEVQLQANCRERDVFVVQPLVAPVQEHLVELLLMLDDDDAALPQVHGFFDVPVDHLHARRELAAHFRRLDLRRGVVVSADLGYAKEAARFARLLGMPVAAAAKERLADDEVVISDIIGDVRGRDVVVVDDEIARGSTIVELLDRLAERDVASVRVACTHGLFAAGALERIATRSDVTEIVCTDTVPVPGESDKLTVLSVAPALAEAVRRIHDGESVSALFDSH